MTKKLLIVSTNFMKEKKFFYASSNFDHCVVLHHFILLGNSCMNVSRPHSGKLVHSRFRDVQVKGAPNKYRQINYYRFTREMAAQDFKTRFH